MKFVDRERKRAVEQREAFFRDPGQGMFASKPRDFVLSEPALNLWAGIREDALGYFEANRISWWKGAQDRPTGHLLSSQIACVNHLYPLRQRPDAATALLQGIDAEIVEAVRVDGGFVEFEFIGSAQVLRERAFTRGANCTSVDAAMIGRTSGGGLRLFLIEWKYVESYAPEDKYIPQRREVYDPHIVAAGSPFRVARPSALYFEPFYQLMRQTLLGHLLIERGEAGCDSWRHVHVAPAENIEFHRRVTSPALSGETVYEAWRNVLVRPELFLTATPEMLLRPIADCPDTRSHLAYLRDRYWPKG